VGRVFASSKVKVDRMELEVAMAGNIQGALSIGP
jgi:hypothetical protein